MIPTTLYIDNKVLAIASIVILAVIVITHRITRFTADRGSNSWEKFRETGHAQCSTAQIVGGARRRRGKFHFKAITEDGEIPVMYHPLRRQLRLSNGKDNKPRQWVKKPGNALAVDRFYSKAASARLAEDAATSIPAVTLPRYEPATVGAEHLGDQTAVLPPEIVAQLENQAKYGDTIVGADDTPQPVYHGLSLTVDDPLPGPSSR